MTEPSLKDALSIRSERDMAAVLVTILLSRVGGSVVFSARDFENTAAGKWTLNYSPSTELYEVALADE